MASEALKSTISGADGQTHCRYESAETPTGGSGYSSTAVCDAAAAAAAADAAAAEAVVHAAPTSAPLIERPVALSPGAQLEADSTVPEALDGSSGGSGAMHICLDQGTDGRSIDGLTGSNSSGVSGGAGYQCESSGGSAAVAAGVAAAAAAAATAAVAAADACFMEAPGAPLLISAKAASQQDDEDERDRKIWTAGYVAAVNNARHERQQRGSGSAGRPRHSSTASASDEDVAQQFTAAVREAQAQLLRADTRLMELQMRAPQNHHQRASNAVCVLRQQLIKMLADVTKMSKRCSALVSIVRAGPDETPAATATPHTAENGRLRSTMQLRSIR
ncbi:hypothetical protein JKP88DRAFT_289197 [Tribonema minus]|uniref:Uncharacterized protein n=1 Tax=Tribonema minus TaxID=303371 RepID=A0A835Z8P1_9STRA|nr:hypothetical protein JKP88DRAFT_289197 [Tribonema minus]